MGKGYSWVKYEKDVDEGRIEPSMMCIMWIKIPHGIYVSAWIGMCAVN